MGRTADGSWPSDTLLPPGQGHGLGEVSPPQTAPGKEFAALDLLVAVKLVIFLNVKMVGLSDSYIFFIEGKHEWTSLSLYIAGLLILMKVESNILAVKSSAPNGHFQKYLS